MSKGCPRHEDQSPELPWDDRPTEVKDELQAITGSGVSSTGRSAINSPVIAWHLLCPSAAYQANAITVLLGHDPPAVVLLLVDPPGPVEGLEGQLGLHGNKGGGEGHPHEYR